MSETDERGGRCSRCGGLAVDRRVLPSGQSVLLCSGCLPDIEAMLEALRGLPPDQCYRQGTYHTEPQGSRWMQLLVHRIRRAAWRRRVAWRRRMGV